MKKLILLINLGTPEAPTFSAVRKYLSEFLSDPRVVQIPRFIWAPLLYTVVLNIRPQRSAALYQKIWLKNGSPLKIGMENLVAKLRPHVAAHSIVEYAMRYGHPSIAEVLKKHADVTEIVVIPLYPQYANSSTGSALEAVMNILKTRKYIPAVKWISDYHNHPLYIQALANSIQTHWQTQGRAQKLILSYHGLPIHQIKQGDPYLQQCQTTTSLLVEKLQIPNKDYCMVFQSRFGKARWLEPSCAETLKTLPSQGIKSIDIICPAFSVDCLETLEEINIRNRKIFMEADGVKYAYIPCLNDSQDQIHLLKELIHATA
jgi:ferrochelatase